MQVRAHNKYGAGPWSSSVSYIAGQKPDTPTVLALTLNDVYVDITWDAPFDNYLAIDAYRILIEANDGTFIETPALCDGSDSTVVAAELC